MNVVLLSPHFPPNYYQFAVGLHELGVSVLGLADEPYNNLRRELRVAFTEYYYANNMHNYDDLLRALGYFIHRYGRIDRIDSHNEYWLETEAQLRTDFNIPGFKVDTIQRVKRKSLMKQTFIDAGVNVARGHVVHTLAEARRFVKEVGYPLVAKPDIGVGAAKTYKIHNDTELKQFFQVKPSVDYILEEFIQGTILTFDGLADRDGTPVFNSSMQYSRGIMETVNEDTDIFYYTLREIPPDLEAAGRKVLKAFDVRERFFHFEFFRSDRDSQIVALEVNMRPPGGLTTDMFNYSNDIDVYREWAHVVVYNRFTAQYTRPYHCCYISRKFRKSYAHTHEQIMDNYGHLIIHHEPISGIFSAALGDYGYLARSPDLDVIFEVAEYIHQLA
jgi:biotin carboxylase